jgi:hypothetical protein
MQEGDALFYIIRIDTNSEELILLGFSAEFFNLA